MVATVNESNPEDIVVMLDECPYTEDEISQFQYGSNDFTHYLQWTASQAGDDSWQPIENLLDFAKEEHTKMFGEQDGVGFPETIGMTINQESTKEQRLAGLYLTITMFIKQRKSLRDSGMSYKKIGDMINMICDETFEKEHWVFFQMQCYFNRRPEIYNMIQFMSESNDTDESSSTN